MRRLVGRRLAWPVRAERVAKGPCTISGSESAIESYCRLELRTQPARSGPESGSTGSVGLARSLQTLRALHRGATPEWNWFGSGLTWSSLGSNWPTRYLIKCSTLSTCQWTCPLPASLLQSGSWRPLDRRYFLCKSCGPKNLDPPSTSPNEVVPARRARFDWNLSSTTTYPLFLPLLALHSSWKQYTSLHATMKWPISSRGVLLAEQLRPASSCRSGPLTRSTSSAR